MTLECGRIQRRPIKVRTSNLLKGKIKDTGMMGRKNKEGDGERKSKRREEEKKGKKQGSKLNLA